MAANKKHFDDEVGLTMSADAQLVRGSEDPDAEPTIINYPSSMVEGKFVKVCEREHDVLYRAYDEVAKSIASTIYLSNDSYKDIGRPDKIIVSVKADK